MAFLPYVNCGARVDLNSRHYVDHVKLEVTGTFLGEGYCIALNTLRTDVSANFGYNKTFDRIDFTSDDELSISPPPHKFYSTQQGCCGDVDMQGFEGSPTSDGSTGHCKFTNGVVVSCDVATLPTVNAGFTISRNSTTGLFTVHFFGTPHVVYAPCTGCFSPPCVGDTPPLVINQSGIPLSSLLGVYTLNLTNSISCSGILGPGFSNYNVTLTVTLT